MYVTRRLSEYQSQSVNWTRLSSEGPNTGVLVIQDKESKSKRGFGLGSLFDYKLKGLPFPQNALVIVTRSDTFMGPTDDRTITYKEPVLFIPVIDQPLSSNRYYVIKRDGKRTEGAATCAKEGDKVRSFLFFNRVREVKPQEANPYDIYQQFEIHQQEGIGSSKFTATSVAPDGVPPEFLKLKWTAKYTNFFDLGLSESDDAKGINTTTRSELPNYVNTNVEVGEMEEVYSCDNNGKGEVVFNVGVETEVVKLGGQETMSEAKRDGFVWFSVLGEVREDKKIGLASVVVERMKWEEERFGWRNNGVRSNINRSERFEGRSSQWKKYRCYVLIESFELKRRDESLVLICEFKHVDKITSKWE